MLDPKPILVRARELIADPEHWTQDNYATDNAGFPVLPFEPDAYCYCILGAVDRAIFEQLGEIPEGQGDSIARVEASPLGGATIQALQAFTVGLVCDFNDEHEHADVLELLDKAIAA